MTIKHNSTVSPGDLVSTTRWNADHTISDAPTIVSVPVIAYPTGITASTVPTSHTDLDYCEFRIPIMPDLFDEGYDKVQLTITGKTTGAQFGYAEVWNDSDSVQLAQCGPMTGSIVAYNSGWVAYTIPNSASKTYKLRLWVDSSTDDITIYYATLYLKKD